MDADDLARIAHYRRWLNPDWRRWLHPDWERFVHPAQRAAMRKDFALRDRAFETPLARRWREEQEEREREEQERLEAEHQAEIEREARQLKTELAALRFELALRRKKWEAECAERKLRADIAWERFMAAFMRGDFAPRQKANFNPNQPRVAAGNPDGGQWTDGSGAQSRTGEAHDRVAGRNDPRVLSDATPDNIFKPGAQLAQNETQRRYSVNLNEEEARGGHTLRNHVGKTDDELLDVARKDWIRRTVGRFEITRFRVAEGSFSSTESANDFVNRTLEDNRESVDRVASGREDWKKLDKRFGYPTGREAFRPDGDTEPYMRNTYGVRVIIQHDTSVSRGYRVRSSFPINEDSSR